MDNDRKRIVKEAVQRFVDGQMQGQQPDIEELVRQHPRLDRQIRESIEDIHRINALFDSLVQAEQGEFEDPSTGGDLVGRRVASFEIVEMIGRGGMGVVYLARDTKLKRSVAIKSMPVELQADSTARMRFRREAELLASLNHPNIAVIHEIIEEEKGTGYLVLEYVAGETLAQRIACKPLKLEQALSIGQQVAEAVSAAHEKGVIHRDLKPGNIKITPDGRVKVLDFGLAKTSASEGADSQITSTEPGHIIGTPAYMSPEQARGNPTDHRTDVWSFGCIMYQMLTGRSPFEGETATDALANILHTDPDWEALPEGTPENIRVLLRRCLEKDLDRRLEDIADAAIETAGALSSPAVAPPPMMRARRRKVAMIVAAVIVLAVCSVAVRFALRGQTPPAPVEIRLVVLPFENLGHDEDEYFADGITDAITARLAGIHGLAVISRQSAIQYKKREKDTRQIAKELRVDYILEGTVQRERPTDPNSRVRIIPQLIKASADTHVWTETYDDNMREIFRLQSDLAEHVAQALDIALLEPERQALASRPTDNRDAYEYYLQGNEYGERTLASRPTEKVEAYEYYLRGNEYRDRSYYEGNSRESSFKMAIRMYERAIELDPNFALPYTKLCTIHCDTYKFNYDRTEERLAMAKQAVDKALELAPDLPEAHLALGHYYHSLSDDDRALEQFAVARKSRPNNPETISEAASMIGYIQTSQGKFEQALANFDKALELNPLNFRLLSDAGYTCEYLRRYVEAERYYDRAILLAPDHPFAYGLKACLYVLREGNTKRARAVLAEALQNIGPTEDILVRVSVRLDELDRDYSKASDRISTRLGDIDNVDLRIFYSLECARIYMYMDKEELAKKYSDDARSILESKIKESPEQAWLHGFLGLAYAGLGRKEDAIREGKRGIELLPGTKDTWVDLYRVKDLARIYVIVGEFDAAIDQLELMLSRSGWWSTPLLQLDPVWDPLRDHPRFKRLLRTHR